MSLIKSLLFTLLLAAAAVQASTRDEIERLWNPQGMAAQPAQPAAGTSARTEKPAPRWFRLSNGRQVNLADWKVVLFMQGHCPYCHQFDPVLKQLAQQYGFSVFPYTLDGQGDTAFPEALPVPPDVMQTFFPNIPVSPAINDKKSDSGVNVPAGGIEQELKMKPEEEMEQQLPPGISESGEVVDMAAYEAWQQENHPDIQQQMQRREEVNINVHRERGEDVEPGDDF